MRQPAVVLLSQSATETVHGQFGEAVVLLAHLLDVVLHLLRTHDFRNSLTIPFSSRAILATLWPATQRAIIRADCGGGTVVCCFLEDFCGLCLPDRTWTAREEVLRDEAVDFVAVAIFGRS